MGREATPRIQFDSGRDIARAKKLPRVNALGEGRIFPFSEIFACLPYFFVKHIGILSKRFGQFTPDLPLELHAIKAIDDPIFH